MCRPGEQLAMSVETGDGPPTVVRDPKTIPDSPFPGAEMHHVTSLAQAGHTTIEVDGSLDAVAAYDLQRCLDSALLRRAQSVALDLTRVTTMDDDGVRGLRRCCDAAVAARVVLTITGCSRPARRSLEFFEARALRQPTQLRAPTA